MRIIKRANVGIIIAVMFCVVTACVARGNVIRQGKAVEIKAITYNICGLPDLVTKDRNLAAAKKRFPIIGRMLKSYDIIALQEVFVPERTALEKKLNTYYIARGTDTGLLRYPGSGIYIYSRWGIPRFMFERWVEARDYDSLSHKGFVAATVRIAGGPEIDVYSLHAQAGWTDFRHKDFIQLVDAMKRFSFGTGRPILALGDFNCSMGEWECKWLIDNSGLKHVSPNPDPDAIDHIFYLQNGSDWKITPVSWGPAFTEPYDGRKLSDHDAFEAVIRFEKE